MSSQASSSAAPQANEAPSQVIQDALQEWEESESEAEVAYIHPDLLENPDLVSMSVAQWFKVASEVPAQHGSSGTNTKGPLQEDIEGTTPGQVITHEQMAQVMTQDQITSTTEHIVALHFLANDLGLVMDMPVFRRQRLPPTSQNPEPQSSPRSKGGSQPSH